MAERLLLKAQIRENVGSKDANSIRKQGQMPAIVYGHKKKPRAVSLSTHDFVEGIHHGHRIMDLQINGDKETVLIKDLQYDHLGKDIIHADLLIVDVTEKVEVAVPINIKGTPKGAEEGGIIQMHNDSIQLECRVTNIPEKLLVSVKELEVGDSLYANDIELPAETKIVSDPETLIVSCNIVTEEEVAEAEEVAEEEPTAPEVIGEEEKKEEEEKVTEEKPQEEKESEKE